MVLALVGCGPGPPGDGSATQAMTGTSQESDGVSTTGGATQASATDTEDAMTQGTGDATTPTTGTDAGETTGSATTGATTGEVCEDLEEVPAGEPDAPCEGGGLLSLWDDEDALAGLEWCPNDSVHRYAAVVCPCDGECRTDDDCGAGSACLCKSVYEHNGYVSEHTCVPADCRTDSDCAPGFACGLSPSMCGFGWELELHCRTPADECVGSEDCDNHLCRFDPEVKAWRCADVWNCE